MRIFALAFAVCAVVGVVSAQEARVPPLATANETVQVTRLLALAVPPADAPNASTWKKTEAVGPVTHSNVKRGVDAADAFSIWLVDQKLCLAVAEPCTFTLRLQYRAEKTEEAQEADGKPGATVIHYVVKGPTGKVVEGYSVSYTLDIATHRYWSYDGTAWKLQAGEVQRQTEYNMLGGLMGIVEELVRRRELTLIR